MAQRSTLGLSAVMERVRSIVAKARSTGSVRNITGEVAKAGCTGAIAHGATNVVGAVAPGDTKLVGSIAMAGVTGSIALQE